MEMVSVFIRADNLKLINYNVLTVLPGTDGTMVLTHSNKSTGIFF